MGRSLTLFISLAALLVMAVAVGMWGLRSGRGPASGGGAAEPAGLAGSQSCRECHQAFHDKWSTSHHGLAMQPFTMELARKQLTAPPTEIKAGTATYVAEFTESAGNVIERSAGGEKRYPIAHLLGGKNVYYFLTPLERGRLQVLPVAYDVRRNEWFDTAASAMRHFQDRSDQPVEWRDPLYTFNTSCHGCHVSQFAPNYDSATDTYRTTWAEPGINCETCHGPSGEHVKLMRKLRPGEKPAELKLISTTVFSVEQHNSSCSSCHAKASNLTHSYQPGERFFDHFDLVTFENADFYADGRDLGENYTYTSWRMNPCAKSGQLSCMHCHTSSGRYRFAGDKANNSCMPCHEERVKNATAHTRHKADSAGNQCIACHMPMTEFGRMLRSDHSMLPPAPAATVAHKSPNACNVCHTDKDAAWADKEVRSWHKEDYQAPMLRRAELVAAARKNDWSKLPEMLAYLGEAQREEVFVTSLIRLLANCPDARKWPAIVAAMKDSSPLVRGAAAAALAGAPTPEAAAALASATADEYRLVRVRAAASMAGYPAEQLSEAGRAGLAAANRELEASLTARPDDWSSQYNLGNHYMDLGRLQEAVKAFGTAAKLRTDVVLPLVNGAIAHARLGQTAAAEQGLTKALALDPANAAANLNLGLLKAEQGDLKKAEQCLRAALKTDPRLAQAAYNLAVILAPDRLPEAVEWCRRAAQAQPRDPKYAYTLGFYLHQQGKPQEAAETLRGVIAQHPTYFSAYALLGEIHETTGEPAKAAEVYRQALARPDLPLPDRRFFDARLRRR